MDESGISAPQTADTPKNAPPRALKLAFAKAADYQRLVASIYSPQTRKAADPAGYVITRREPVVRAALADGGGAFLVNGDDPGTIVTATLAYKSAAAPCTEIGSTLSSVQGYGAAKLVIAALALREALRKYPPDLIAAIQPHNAASLATYRDQLGWQEITDAERSAQLFEITGKPVPAPGAKSWFECTDASLAAQAAILLEAMAQGGIINKNGHKIPVDFSALPEAGLTEARLKGFANLAAKPVAV